jgi:nitrous oxide reductase accessory protein NosL
MLISSEANGGEIVSSREETRFYDDIGCLASDWTTHRDNARAFVRVAGRWMEASAASYAQPKDSETPMGSGIAAFNTREEARASDRSGRSLTFDEVVRMSGAAR